MANNKSRFSNLMGLVRSMFVKDKCNCNNTTLSEFFLNKSGSYVKVMTGKCGRCGKKNRNEWSAR